MCTQQYIKTAADSNSRRDYKSLNCSTAGVSRRTVALLGIESLLGIIHRITTTTKNTEVHKDSISLSDLLATFRHADQITRELGIAYLWIDSLCIIQDDAGDWGMYTLTHNLQSRP